MKNPELLALQLNEFNTARHELQELTRLKLVNNAFNSANNNLPSNNFNLEMDPMYHFVEELRNAEININEKIRNLSLPY